MNDVYFEVGTDIRYTYYTHDFNNVLDLFWNNTHTQITRILYIFSYSHVHTAHVFQFQ